MIKKKTYAQKSLAEMLKKLKVKADKRDAFKKLHPHVRHGAIKHKSKKTPKKKHLKQIFKD